MNITALATAVMNHLNSKGGVQFKATGADVELHDIKDVMLDSLNKCPTNDDKEVVVQLADGCTLRSGVYNPGEDSLVSGEYVRLCSPDGKEVMYWDEREWAIDPALVMGAIINVASGVRLEE